MVLCFGIEEIEQILIVNRSMEICRYWDRFALQRSHVPCPAQAMEEPTVFRHSEHWTFRICRKTSTWELNPGFRRNQRRSSPLTIMQRSLWVHCSIKYDNPGRLEQAVSGEPGLASASGGSKLDSSQTTFLTPLSLSSDWALHRYHQPTRVKSFIIFNQKNNEHSIAFSRQGCKTASCKEASVKFVFRWWYHVKQNRQFKS